MLKIKFVVDLSLRDHGEVETSGSNRLVCTSTQSCESDERLCSGPRSYSSRSAWITRSFKIIKERIPIVI